MRDTVYNFIKSNFVFDDRMTLTDEESLLGSGIIDSTGILELISFLEREYSITFEDGELIGENFSSIATIVAFLERKTNRR